MRGKRAYLGKRRKSLEEELWEILRQPRVAEREGFDLCHF
jgi:hypothetical protein